MKRNVDNKGQKQSEQQIDHSSLEVSMLNKDNFSDEELESYLSKGQIRISDKVSIPKKS